MTDKETLLLVIKISILFLLLCVLYQITNENNNSQNEKNIKPDEPKSRKLDDTYSCDPTNKTVTNSKEHTPDRNCLLQKIFPVVTRHILEELNRLNRPLKMLLPLQKKVVKVYYLEELPVSKKIVTTLVRTY